MVTSNNKLALEQALSDVQQRLQEATEQRAKQAPAYDSDPLFVYLWDRAWGTSEYQGRGVVRLIDGWVADISGYAQARTAYWMLNEIPIRLQQRVSRLTQELSAASAIGRKD